jgi:hypothetical protein
MTCVCVCEQAVFFSNCLLACCGPWLPTHPYVHRCPTGIVCESATCSTQATCILTGCLVGDALPCTLPSAHITSLLAFHAELFDGHCVMELTLHSRAGQHAGRQLRQPVHRMPGCRLHRCWVISAAHHTAQRRRKCRGLWVRCSCTHTGSCLLLLSLQHDS